VGVDVEVCGWVDVPMFDVAPFEEPRDVNAQNVTVVEEVTFSTIETVFNHYVDTLWSRLGARPHLTDKRARNIRKAVQMYGQKAVENAITGITHSAWHMGQNPQGKKYNNLELILRPHNIEKFSQLAEQHNTKGGFL
jgi:hypothetical protein